MSIGICPDLDEMSYVTVVSVRFPDLLSVMPNTAGEVTGSNSVNVFLGIGMPWLLASFYWYLQERAGQTPLLEWNQMTWDCLHSWANITELQRPSPFTYSSVDFSTPQSCLCCLWISLTVAVSSKYRTTWLLNQAVLRAGVTLQSAVLVPNFTRTRPTS